MTETEDPRAALRGKDLPAQAAAARDLAAIGTWDDLDALLEIAGEHRRTGLRLACAGAAADIVHRAHLGRGLTPPSQAQARSLVQRISRIDPGANPGVPGVLALVPGPEALVLLGRQLADPRNTVRLSAALAVRRRALSHRGSDRDALVQSIASWLRSPRIPPDARADLAAVVGQADLHELADDLDDLDGPSPVTKAASEARRLLRERADPATWAGLWRSDGLDVLEPGEPGPPHDLLIFGGAASLDLAPAAPAEVIDGSLEIGSMTGPLRLRWVLAPRLGHAEPRPAVQIDGRTWVRAEGAEEIVTFIRDQGAALDPSHLPASLALTAALTAESSAASSRALPAAQLVTGQLDEALPALEKAAAGKRPRAEDLLWLAVAKERTGDRDAAVAGYRDYLERGGRKPWGIALALERLAASGASVES